MLSCAEMSGSGSVELLESSCAYVLCCPLYKLDKQFIVVAPFCTCANK